MVSAMSAMGAEGEQALAMVRADEFRSVLPEVLFWEAYDPGVKCVLSSAAVHVGDGWLLVDPIALSAEALGGLCALGSIRGVLLTNGNHDRAAEWYREKFRVPVLASELAARVLETRVDQVVREGEVLFGVSEVVGLQGAGPGEIALCSHGRVVSVGDALIHLESHGFALLPERYCEDARELRLSLQKLLRFECEVLTFAHGSPLVREARQQLHHLLS